MFNRNSFATLVKVFVLAAFLVTALESSAFAEDWRNLSVVNNTGKTINYLYITPNDDTWDHDLLGSYTLENGHTYTISYDSDAHFYNIKVVYDDGGSFELNGTFKVNLTRAYELKIFDGYVVTTAD